MVERRRPKRRSICPKQLFFSLLAGTLLLLPIALAGQIEEDIVAPLLDDDHEGTLELSSLLGYYRTNRLDLASTGPQQLAAIPGISLQLAERIVTFVSSASPTEIDELGVIPGVDAEILSLLRSIATLQRESADPIVVDLRVRSRLESPARRGFVASQTRIVEHVDSTGSIHSDTLSIGKRQLGPPGSLFVRAGVASGPWSASLVFDRDPGEQLLYHDTLSYSYRLNEQVSREDSVGRVRTGLGIFLSGFVAFEAPEARVIVGDYSLAYGHGLLFGRPFDGRKGGDVTRNPLGSSAGIRPYRSRTEGGYLRGIALRSGDSLFLDGLRLDAFVSQRHLDGSLVPVIDDDSTALAPGSIDISGDLSTRTDLRRDDRIEETIVGAHLEQTGQRGTIGLTGYRLTRLPRIDTGARLLALSRLFTSIDGQIRLGRQRLFGEVALDNAGAGGIVVGLALDIGSIDVTFALRSFTDQFDPPHGRPFAESPGSVSGEHGLYAGIRLRPIRRLRLSLYLDRFRRPANDRRIADPIVGSDGYLSARFGTRSTGMFEASVRLRNRDDVRLVQDIDEVDRPQISSLHGTMIRLRGEWQPPGTELTLRAGFERRSERIGPEPEQSGHLSYIDARLPIGERISLGSRLALSGGNRGVRTYMVEQDLPGGLSLLSLAGEASRLYLLGSWRLSEQILIGLRIASTHYLDRRTISAGTLREIDGPVATSVTLGLDWRLDTTHPASHE